jgi:hypothetical protein
MSFIEPLRTFGAGQSRGAEGFSVMKSTIWACQRAAAFGAESRGVSGDGLATRYSLQDMFAAQHFSLWQGGGAEVDGVG